MMKIRLMLTSAVFFVMTAVSTQVLMNMEEDEPYHWSYVFEPGSRQLVFAGVARIFAFPDSIETGSLPADDCVRVLEKPSVWQQKSGLEAPWYRVQYTERLTGRDTTGWIWGGDLALYSILRDSVLFTFGGLPQLTQRDADNEVPSEIIWVLRAKTARGRVQSAEYCIDAGSQFFSLEDGTDRDSICTSPIGAGRQWPVASRFSIGFGLSGMAASQYNYRLFALWDGARLIKMPVLKSSGGAGLGGYDEQYQWPDDQGGKPGRLVVNCEEFVCPEGCINVREPHHSKRIYRWNARSAQFYFLKKVSD